MELEQCRVFFSHLPRTYHWLPKNWPEGKIVYTSSVIWKDACRDLYQKYQEHSTLGECTQIRINAKGQVGLHARLDLPATCLLERYVGEVIDGREFATVARNDLHVFLYDYGAGRLYVDSNAVGSLTRFIRKVEPEDPEVNCVIIPINLDGVWQLFVELQREIKVGEELVMARYYGYHGEDLAWKGKLHLTFPNTVNHDLTEESPSYHELLQYTSTDHLIYDRLEDGHHFLAGKRCLADWCELRTVADKSLPYCGQIGVYAACDIRSGTYIGEYCGEVFVCDGQSESLYVAKFENSFEAEETDLVRIDGLKVGNEMRYINDSRNTGRSINVQFILAWIGGCLHLFVVSVVDIKKDEELLIDYGAEYWSVLQDWHDANDDETDSPKTKAKKEAEAQEQKL